MDRRLKSWVRLLQLEQPDGFGVRDGFPDCGLFDQTGQVNGDPAHHKNPVPGHGRQHLPDRFPVYQYRQQRTQKSGEEG